MFPTQSSLGEHSDQLPCMALGLEEDLASHTNRNNGNGGDADNGFELFPDLQGLKRSFSRCLSSDSTSSGVVMDSGSSDKSLESGDDEFFDYLTQCGRDSEPTETSQSPRAANVAKVKVTRVSPGGVPGRGGKAFLVDVNDGRMSMVNPLIVYQPNRTCSPGLSPVSTNQGGNMTAQQNSLCMTKNAIAARENRQKKKQYTGELEKVVEKLTTENKTLQRNVSQMSHTVKSLKTEVDYLRSVLVNQSTLSALLQKIPLVSGVNILSSEKLATPSAQVKVMHNKRKAEQPQIDLVENSESDSECEKEDGAVSNNNVNGSKCQKENQYGCQGVANKQTHDIQKLSQLDHSYASDTGNNTTSGDCSAASQRSDSKPKRMKKRHIDRQIPASDDTTGGVCLHVSGSNVSLEFCADCSRKSRSAVQAKGKHKD